MFAFGLSRPTAAKALGMELLDDLAQIFLLAKGWRNVVRVADGLECRAGSTICPPPPPHNPSMSSTLATDTEAAFGRLHALNQGHETAVYALAISSLKAVFETTLADEGRNDPHVALEWANTLPEEFVRLIRERQGLALLIVGHYCVVLDRVPQVWWLRGWSEGLFGVVWRNIELTYREALKWPGEMIGIKG